MTAKMDKYLERLQIILNSLTRKGMSRGELELRFIKKADAKGSFSRTLSFLLKSGLVKKDGDWRPQYCITEKGLKLLEVLR